MHNVSCPYCNSTFEASGDFKKPPKSLPCQLCESSMELYSITPAEFGVPSGALVVSDKIVEITDGFQKFIGLSVSELSAYAKKHDKAINLVMSKMSSKLCA